MTTLRLPKPYSREELERLLRVPSRRDVRAAMIFLAETGLRAAEFRSIPSEEAAAWPVPGRILGRRRDHVIRITGKGDKERVVLLSAEALRAAHELLGYSSNGHLLPWSPRGLRWLIEKAGEEAGVHAHPHRFRHTAITEWVEAGTPIEVVADMAGHSSIQTTRLYFSSSVRLRREAIRRRRRWLRRP